MSEQNTLYRTLEMMTILSRAGGTTTRELAERYDVSPRSIQRTIQTLREAGYVIDLVNGRYKMNRLETKKSSRFDIGDLLHFSKEEAWMLNRAIASIPGRNAIKENLTRKLYSLYGSDSVVNNLVRQEDSDQVRIIIEAIQHKWQIVVAEYTMSSANRGLHEVTIEPIAFASDYTRLWAFFPKKNKNFLLRLSGIHGVKATFEPWKSEHFHRQGYIDVFRGYGFSKTPFKMLLNRRAYGFMLEEFPLAKQLITQVNNLEYILETEICDFLQPARFYLGLPGDTKVLEPDGFFDYIKNEIYTEYSEEEDMAYAVTAAKGEVMDKKPDQ